MIENIINYSIATNEVSHLQMTNWIITSTFFIDEQSQIVQLHQQILALEKAEKVDEAQIKSLKATVAKLIFEQEEKQLLMRRLNSLETLNKAMRALTTNLTLKEAQLWQIRLANARTSAKKETISKKIKEKITALQLVSPKTQKELWVSELVKNKHHKFINLTTTAREDVLKKLANNEQSLHYIDYYIDYLEEQVKDLHKESDIYMFIENLEKLPLKSFLNYYTEEKEFIARTLMKQAHFESIRELEKAINEIHHSYESKQRLNLAGDIEGATILLENEVHQLLHQNMNLK